MPEETPGYPAAADASPRYLKGERRIVTLIPRTGLIATNPGDRFDGSDTMAPFYAGRNGIRTAD
jgi:hypothetical protein